MLKSDGFYDYAWNPVEGCTNGCSYCYAEKDIKRQGKSFEPTFYPERLTEPLKLKTKKRIFVTHYTDLFSTVPSLWIDQVLSVIKDSKHDYIFLTKNPVKYYDFTFTDNCILGVTVEDSRKWWRVLAIEKLKARKIISIEPILGSFDGCDLSQFELVVIGALMGVKNQTKSEWVNSVKHENIYYKNNVRQLLK